MKKIPYLYQTAAAVALATLCVLAIPFVAMQYTTDVDWSTSDFFLAGSMLFITGMSLLLLIRFSSHILFKLGVIVAIGATFLMIWANLAVGLIGSGANIGNLLYIGVIGVFIGGVILSKFTAKGMKRAMFAATLALIVLAAIALLNNMHQDPDSSVIEVIGVNVFFAGLYSVAGVLFHATALSNRKSKITYENR